MTDQIPDLPQHQDDVIYGATCAAYHLFDKLTLSVPPSPRLKEIRRLIALMREISDRTSEADARGVDGEPSTQSAQT